MKIKQKRNIELLKSPKKEKFLAIKLSQFCSFRANNLSQIKQAISKTARYQVMVTGKGIDYGKVHRTFSQRPHNIFQVIFNDSKESRSIPPFVSEGPQALYLKEALK